MLLASLLLALALELALVLELELELRPLFFSGDWLDWLDFLDGRNGGERERRMEGAELVVVAKLPIDIPLPLASLSELGSVCL